MIAYIRCQWRRRSVTLGFMAFATLWSAWMCQGYAQEAPRPNGSLWGKSSRSLHADYRAHRVGDTITIIVQETASASSSASTKADRTDSVDFPGATGTLRNILKPLGIRRDVFGPFGASTSGSLSGQGQTNRSGSLITKLTAVVKEVLPNGNLVIEGSRIVGVNAEKQKVIINGVARPEDIAADNTISSIALANATIQYDGRGPVGDRQKRGLLSTIFGWLF